MRDKVLLPLKQEIIKIQVSVDSDKKDQNQSVERMLDFKLVFRKDSNQNATPSDRSRKNKNDLEIYTFRDFMN